jgi:uncharacterized membrane protein YvlD (DUF360 family)
MKSLFITQVAANGVALWVATRIVPGVRYDGGWLSLAGVSLVFGVVNTFVATRTRLPTVPATALAKELFIFASNGLLLGLAAWLSDAGRLGFHVDGLEPACLGTIVITIVSTALNALAQRPGVIIVHRDT